MNLCFLQLDSLHVKIKKIIGSQIEIKKIFSLVRNTY
jgi:hypothetical protein